MDVIKEGLLKLDPGLLLWTIITFSVLLLLLWKTAWKPIVDALDSRAEKVRGDIDHADKARQDAEKILAEHKELMSNAKQEASDIIEKGKDAAEKIKNEIIEKATSEANTLAVKVKKEISLSKDKALAEIKTEIVLLSTEIASKIIQKNLNPEDQNNLVKETLDEIKTVQ
jgi:F-type H+-transporting ATPase subunit b